MRMYHSCRADMRGRLTDENKLLARTTRACAKVAKQIGATTEQVWADVEREAHKQGPLTPLPGRDI